MFTLKHSCPVATDIGDMGEAIVMEYIVFRELSWLEEAAATLQNRIIVMKKWIYIYIDRCLGIVNFKLIVMQKLC